MRRNPPPVATEPRTFWVGRIETPLGPLWTVHSDLIFARIDAAAYRRYHVVTTYVIQAVGGHEAVLGVQNGDGRVVDLDAVGTA